MYGALRGVPVSCEPIWLASKFSTAVKSYRHEINPLDAQVLSSLSLAAAPSGTGELTISGLSFAAGVVTFTLAAGQPTREYTLLLTATRSDSLVSDYLFKLRVDPVLSSDQAQAIPSSALGTADTWTAA